MHSVADVTAHSFSRNEKVFLDTNIWFLVFVPTSPNDNRVRAYSQAFARLLEAKSPIFIDVLVLSEFINTYARLRWNVAGKPFGDFKKFRLSSEFKPLAREIASDARRILKHCDRVDSGFETLDIADLIIRFETECPDFNDQILAGICKSRGFTLLTDDRDFRGCGVPILTANQRLLR